MAEGFVITQNGQYMEGFTDHPLWRTLADRIRSIKKLKKSTLWEVVKKTYLQPQLWHKPERLKGPLTMPKNKKGWGGGTDHYAYTHRKWRKGKKPKGPKNVINIDLRRSGFRIYSTRPYPPMPNDAMSTFLGTILLMWIIRGN